MSTPPFPTGTGPIATAPTSETTQISTEGEPLPTAGTGQVPTTGTGPRASLAPLNPLK